MASILHVTASTGGGAGRAVMRLHLGLQALGHDSAVLCLNDPANSPGACVIDGAAADKDPSISVALARWKTLSETVAGRGNRTSISNTLFSIGYPGYDVTALDITRAADVIHLHWTPRILSIRGIDDLLRLGKPTFWTQHDFWATTSGCHYPAAETEFVGPGAGRGHLATAYDLSELLIEDKRRAFDHDNLTIVTLSEAAEACYRKRSIFQSRGIVTGLNGVDLEHFAPLPEEERRGARRMLGVEDDCILVVLLAQDVREKRKGFGHLAEALNGSDAFPELSKLRDQGRIALMTIGARGSEKSFPGFRTFAFDSVSEDSRLGRMIALADVTIVSSSEEVFSLALLEAWACGVPAIALPNGGLAEATIEDGVNGLLAQGRPAARALGLALERFCAVDYPRDEMRLGARKTAERYSLKAAARRALEIYGLEPAQAKIVPATETIVPQRKIAARLDPRPSDWLAQQLLEPRLLKILADKASTGQPKPPADRPAEAGGSALAAKAVANQPPNTASLPKPTPNVTMPPSVTKAPPPANPMQEAKAAAPPQSKTPNQAPLATQPIANSAPSRPSRSVAAPKAPFIVEPATRDLTPELILARGARLFVDGAIHFKAVADGHLVYGPHIKLPPGRYRLTAYITLEPTPWRGLDSLLGGCVVECVHDRLDYLAQSTIKRPLLRRREQRIHLEFDAQELINNSSGFEFRIWARRGVTGELSSVILMRHDPTN